MPLLMDRFTGPTCDPSWIDVKKSSVSNPPHILCELRCRSDALFSSSFAGRGTESRPTRKSLEKRREKPIGPTS